MHTDLTEKQREYLEYLKGWIAREGRAPSLRQAAGDLGVSHAAVAQSLRALEEKGFIKREGRYSRTIHLLNQVREAAGALRWREVPIVGRVTAGLPMYAQSEWDGSVLLDAGVFRGQNLFALRVKGNSMTGAGILNGDLAICEPRQFAENGEIVVALIDSEEATVKRFFLRKDHIELRPANRRFRIMKYDFGQVLIQGKVIGIQRGPEGMI
ncbi:MAG: transcriptional repressor LexA [Desulfobacterales bacterium]|nr:transcriptional repressor LexA [Desulfobacterales bacterium]